MKRIPMKRYTYTICQNISCDLASLYILDNMYMVTKYNMESAPELMRNCGVTLGKGNTSNI